MSRIFRTLALRTAALAALATAGSAQAAYRIDFGDDGTASYAFYDYPSSAYGPATTETGFLQDGRLTFRLPVLSGVGDIAVAPAGASACDAATCLAGLRFIQSGGEGLLQFIEPAGNGSQAATGFPADFFFGSVIQAASPAAFTFVAGDGSFALSNFYAGTISAAAAVPEPSSWLLLVGGFGLAGGALRRRGAGAVVRV